MSIHSIWKAWLHKGSNLSLSCSENSHKQTAQSNGSFKPTISLYWNTGSASIKAWSNPESWRWKSCCNCLWNASEFEKLSGYLLDWEKDEEDLYFVKNLTNKWRRPE